MMQKKSVSFLQNRSHNHTSHKNRQYFVSISVMQANPVPTITS